MNGQLSVINCINASQESCNSFADPVLHPIHKQCTHRLSLTLVAYNSVPLSYPKCICTQYIGITVIIAASSKTKRHANANCKCKLIPRMASVKSFPIKFVCVAGNSDDDGGGDGRARIIQQNVENSPNKFICIRIGCGCTVRGFCFIVISLELELVQLVFAHSYGAHALQHIC